MALSGMVSRHVRLGGFSTQALILVASNLAVDAILGTAFIDRHVRGILSRERKVLLRHGSAVTLLGSKPGPEADGRATKRIPTATVSIKIRVAKHVLFPPMSEREMLINTDARGLQFLQNHPKAGTKNLSLMANGIMKCAGSPLRVTLSNFGDRSVCLAKGAVIVVALPASGAVVTVTSKQAARFGLTESERNGMVDSSTDEEPSMPIWREQVDIGPEHAAYREKSSTFNRTSKECGLGGSRLPRPLNTGLTSIRGPNPSINHHIGPGNEPEEVRKPRSEECSTKE